MLCRECRWVNSGLQNLIDQLRPKYSGQRGLCVFCVGPLCGPPLRWWVLCGALPYAWVPCVGPLCGSPVWVPCVGPLCVGPLCGSSVWVSRRAASVWHLLAWCLPLVHTLPLKRGTMCESTAAETENDMQSMWQGTGTKGGHKGRTKRPAQRAAAWPLQDIV